MKKVNYGIDAPKVITRLLIIGAVIILLCLIFPRVEIGEVELVTSGFIWAGISMVVVGIFMILYSKFGKFKHRDRILDKIRWQGNEIVLDVGTGLGLLMIGAAKKLTSGKSIGIDIFAQKDLSGNALEKAQLNADLEKVSDKVEILKMNILKTDFPDNYFDVILSNLCLHNIDKSADRKAACDEIYRIIKPEGMVVISDFTHIREYMKEFKKLGMTVYTQGPYFWDTFPPLTMIIATKPKGNNPK